MAGTSVFILQNYPNGDSDGGTGPGNIPLLTINPMVSATAVPMPAQLNNIDRKSTSSAAVTRDMVLAGGGNRLTINGQTMTTATMDMSNMLQVRLGDTEIWNLINRSGDTHVFHVHDVQFQILDRSSGPLAAYELGWKDTIRIRPRETARIIMRFTDFADPMNPYMFHCHLLEHEDDGMMGEFVVVST